MSEVPIMSRRGLLAPGELVWLVPAIVGCAGVVLCFAFLTCWAVIDDTRIDIFKNCWYHNLPEWDWLDAIIGHGLWALPGMVSLMASIRVIQRRSSRQPVGWLSMVAVFMGILAVGINLSGACVLCYFLEGDWDNLLEVSIALNVLALPCWIAGIGWATSLFVQEGVASE